MFGIAEALALADARPGKVEPGTRPPQPRKVMPDRFGRMIASRRAHMENARCQVADFAPTNTMEYFSEMDFRRIYEQAPKRCCAWCVKWMNNPNK